MFESQVSHLQEEVNRMKEDSELELLDLEDEGKEEEDDDDDDDMEERWSHLLREGGDF